MRILGLDPSLTSTGWCVIDTMKPGKDRVIAKGTIKTKPRMALPDRYVLIRETVREIIREHNPDKLGIESPIFGGESSSQLFAVWVYVQEAVRAERRDFVALTPPQVKSHARLVLERPAGWKMEKADMVEAARHETGGSGRWKHDEADAYWIATIAGRFWDFHAGDIAVEDLTDVERHQFARERTFVRGRKAGQTERTGLIYRGGDRFFLWSDQ